MLWRDDVTGASIALVRFQPGTGIPSRHAHASNQFMFCLRGRYTYVPTGLTLTEGSFYWNPKGSVHGPTRPNRRRCCWRSMTARTTPTQPDWYTAPTTPADEEPHAKKEIVSAALAVPNGHFAQATVATPGRLVFISGMTARMRGGRHRRRGRHRADPSVCQNLKAAIEAAGGTLDDIARVDVYVRDIADFDAIHAVRRQYFTGLAPASTWSRSPASSTRSTSSRSNAIGVLS